MNILLSCVGKRGYIADFFVKELGDQCKVVGTSNSRWTVGFDHCHKNCILPNVGSPEYIPALLELCQKEQIDTLLSFFDYDVYILSQHLDQFRAIGVTPIIPSPQVCTIAFNKYLTALFLEANGLPTPKTYMSLKKAMAALENGDLTFPVFVKPAFGYASKDLYRVYNLQDMITHFTNHKGMIIQEFIKGVEYSYDLFNDLEGKLVTMVCKRKILMRSGETDKSETIYNTKMMEIGKRLAEVVGHVGPMDVDLMMQDGKPYILELNPRFGGGYPNSYYAGANYVKLIIDLVRRDQAALDKVKEVEFLVGSKMMKEPKLVVNSFFEIESN